MRALKQEKRCSGHWGSNPKLDSYNERQLQRRQSAAWEKKPLNKTENVVIVG